MKVTFTKYIDNDSIVMLKGKTKLEVLNEIISKAAQRSQLDRDLIFRLTWKREQMMSHRCRQRSWTAAYTGKQHSGSDHHCWCL